MGVLPSGPQRAERNRRDTRPAVGLIATESNKESIERAIRRASDLGYEVFVAPGCEESAELVRQLDGTVVRPHESDGDHKVDDLRVALAAAARDAEFPGLILSEESTGRIDYTRSISTFRERDSYVVPAVDLESAHARETDPIVAGIPAYNEGETIGQIVDMTTEYVDEVVVVDDGSADRTAEEAKREGAVVIRHSANRGKGAALRSLLDYAERRSCSALVLLDGDGQHLPRDIPTVVQPVLDGDADVVIGSRYLRQGMGTETPLYRRLGQRVLDQSISFLFGVSVSDTQSGFRALSPEAVEDITIRTNGMAVETEMLDAANRNDLTIAERPIRVQYDVRNGQTYNPVRHGVTVLGRIVQLVARGLLNQSSREGTDDRGRARDAGTPTEGERAARRRERAVALGNGRTPGESDMPADGGRAPMPGDASGDNQSADEREQPQR
ncbi:glycosyltransferase family 2 protein (plasmid) [Halorussus limi]|uniref:Glycosyltransferase family 2 protein n=1 Tax=Halorussus limi TaxID=2938695 RepID=A0A8U0HZX8_9EURY|nr:glycosyltransferase family 2 protein [Halorussus limi]UPV76665.1 glycosyltransferase family 2 protein [Halorussus limi]